MYDDYVGAYGMMSGTSMAAPHMTGLTALVQQDVQNEAGRHSQDPHEQFDPAAADEHRPSHEG